MECPADESEGGTYFPDPSNPCSSDYCVCVNGNALKFVSDTLIDKWKDTTKTIQVKFILNPKNKGMKAQNMPSFFEILELV